MADPPLWLLDVDGVLNAVVADVPHLYERLRAEAGGRGWNITYDPAIITRIAELHTSGAVEVRWLTTWCQDAATSLAPAIGLPPFVVEGIPDYKRQFRPQRWWKSDAAERLSDADPDRALIWTDDDLDYSERVGDVPWLAQRTGPTLALSPNPLTGLTANNLDRIETFAARVQSSPSQGGQPAAPVGHRVCSECGGSGTWPYQRGETPRPWHERGCSLDPSPPRQITGTGWPRGD